jgi:RNA polymerase sigma-70 factor (ECF subfamily)
MAAVSNPDPGSQNFAIVLAAAQSGAGWAASKLWQEYSPAVSAYLRARGTQEWEDLTSEVFLAVFNQLPQFVGDDVQFRSFVFSIAYRRLVDEYRSRSRRGTHIPWDAETDDRTSPSAEDAALHRASHVSTISLLDSLPDDQRNVMTLRIIGDLTVEQIAEVLGKQPGAVKALQRRALERLRKEIARGRTPGDPSVDSSR